MRENRKRCEENAACEIERTKKKKRNDQGRKKSASTVRQEGRIESHSETFR